MHLQDTVASLLDPDYSIIGKAIVIHEGEYKFCHYYFLIIYCLN